MQSHEHYAPRGIKGCERRNGELIVCTARLQQRIDYSIARYKDAIRRHAFTQKRVLRPLCRREMQRRNERCDAPIHFLRERLSDIVSAQSGFDMTDRYSV